MRLPTSLRALPDATALPVPVGTPPARFVAPPPARPAVAPQADDAILGVIVVLWGVAAWLYQRMWRTSPFV